MNNYTKPLPMSYHPTLPWEASRYGSSYKNLMPKFVREPVGVPMLHQDLYNVLAGSIFSSTEASELIISSWMHGSKERVHLSDHHALERGGRLIGRVMVEGG